MSNVKALLGQAGGERELRVKVCRGHADRGTRGVKLRLGGQDVGALMDECRGKTQGEVAGKGELIEVELGWGPFRRRLAGKDGKGVAGGVELLAQRGGGGVVGGELALSGPDV